MKKAKHITYSNLLYNSYSHDHLTRNYVLNRVTPTTPFVERMRSTTLDDLAGQQHRTGKRSILRTVIENGNVLSYGATWNTETISTI